MYLVRRCADLISGSTIKVTAGNDWENGDEYNIFVNMHWLGQKVKGQGHSRQWPKNLLNTISHKPMKRISPDFGHSQMYLGEML